MKRLRVLLLITLFSWTLNTTAQNLEQHLWENRLILVYSEERDSKELKRQLAELSGDMEGFDDRRLVIYTVSGDYYRKGFEKTKWKNIEASFDGYFTAGNDFEVLLLGLDGGVKLRQDQILSREKMYSTIDAMPMRQSELRNRN